MDGWSRREHAPVRSAVPRLLVPALFVLGCAVATYVGRASIPAGGELALAWPAAGIGVWFLSRLDGRPAVVWAVIALLLSSYLVNVTTGLAAAPAAAFAATNAVHAVVGLLLLRRLVPRSRGMVEPSDVTGLLLVAFGAASIGGLASALAASTLLGESFVSSLPLFVVRNGGSTFVVMATVLALSAPHRPRDLFSRKQLGELSLVVAASTVVHLAVFAVPGRLPILFLAIATSVWVGSRLGVPRTGVISAAACLLALVQTVTGHGALAAVQDEQVRAVLVQAFAVVLVLVSLTLATTRRSRDELALELAATTAVLQATTDSAVIGKALLVRGPTGWTFTRPNPALVSLLHRDPTGTSCRGLLDADGADQLETTLDEVAVGQRATWQGEVRHQLPGGSTVWTQLHVSGLPAPHRASGLVAQFLDVTERHAMQEDLLRLAHHDGLTGLPNRARMLSDLEALLARPDAPGTAVMFVDVDRFKSVNDTWGHATGDRVLVQVAAALRSSLRGDDLVARFGGDEFVVCCPGSFDEQSATALVDRLLQVLRPSLLLDGAEVGLDVSVGLSLSLPGEGATAVVGRADSDMYRVKRTATQRETVLPLAPDPA